MKLNRFLTTNSSRDNEVYIPQRFCKQITLHIFKNYYANKYHDFETPLILAISGPPGMGKTYQTNSVLDDLGVKKFKISGAEFENENAGIPAKNILNTYKSVADDVFDRKIEFGAIVIDDIDAALGQWEGIVQYTMNRQLLIKALIDLADSPYKLDTRDEDGCLQCYETCRIPLIVTLNDETKMYKPLMRNGRTTIFTWMPEEEEISSILDSIFSGIILTDSNKPVSPYDLYQHLLTYTNDSTKEAISTLPLSLFSDIKSAIHDDYLWKELNCSSSFDIVARNFEKELHSSIVCEFSKVLNIGQKLIHKNINYLDSNNSNDISDNKL